MARSFQVGKSGENRFLSQVDGVRVAVGGDLHQVAIVEDGRSSVVNDDPAVRVGHAQAPEEGPGVVKFGDGMRASAQQRRHFLPLGTAAGVGTGQVQVHHQQAFGVKHLFAQCAVQAVQGTDAVHPHVANAAQHHKRDSRVALGHGRVRHTQLSRGVDALPLTGITSRCDVGPATRW
jgi:hypothetical protein